jgi:hypothetical protein
MERFRRLFSLETRISERARGTVTNLVERVE